MNPVVLITPIEVRHIAGYRQCLDEVARERKYLAFLQAPSLADTRAYVVAQITRRCPYFVALDGENVVGWADMYVSEMPGFQHVGRFGMGVLASYRRQGIGRRLMEACLAEAEHQGYQRIELEVFATNIHAIRLYERLGFTMEGRRIKARCVDGVYDDILMMAKLLSMSHESNPQKLPR